MLVGHLAIGLSAKRIKPRLSLGTLVLASMLADLLSCVFLIVGLEHVRLIPGRGAVHYLDGVDMPFSHSLLMDAVWGGFFAGGYFAWRRTRREALRSTSRDVMILFAAVISHWLLDFASHTPDMALAPGTDGRYGLGLWSSLPATLVVEGGLWLLAIILYVRSTRPAGQTGVYAFWGVAALLTLVWYNNIAGPPPASVRAAGIGGLIFFSLVVAWSYWIDRLRPYIRPVSETRPATTPATIE